MINDLSDPLWKKLRKYIDLSCCHWMLLLIMPLSYNMALFSQCLIVFILKIYLSSVIEGFRYNTKKWTQSTFHYRQSACIEFQFLKFSLNRLQKSQNEPKLTIMYYTAAIAFIVTVTWRDCCHLCHLYDVLLNKVLKIVCTSKQLNVHENCMYNFKWLYLIVFVWQPFYCFSPIREN